MNRLWIALRTFIYAPLFLAAWAWVGWMCRSLDRYIALKIPASLVVPGIVLVLAGAALALTTVGLFVYQGFGTPALFDPPKKLVPRGPYKFVRNPMYVGGVAMLIGWGLSLRSPSVVLYGVVAFIIFHTFVVLAEEPGLRKRFGTEYEEFCKAVPRWIPRLTRPNPHS
jgi:protein-S-isoprenylcysteine O-methyltransferase Ste14